MNHPTGRLRRSTNRRADAPPRTAYTVREAAASLGVPYKRALRLVREGRIRSRRDGQQFIVPIDAVEEFLKGSDSPATT